MEPLRAGAVVWLEDGVRFLCDTHCRQRFLQGERRFGAAQVASRGSRDPSVNPPAPRVSIPPAPRAHVHAERFSRANKTFRIVAGISLAGCLASIFAARTWVAACAASAALVIAWLPVAWQRDREARWIMLPSSAGASVAAIAGLIASLQHEGAQWILFGANVAAVLLVLRTALDARTRVSVDAATRQLIERLPLRVRIADSTHDPLSGFSLQEKETSRVRSGEEIVVLEGESVGVDGIVRAGEAKALLHPTAETPVHRGVGDPVLAGARIIEGGVRVLATRVSDDRALCRPSRFGDGLSRESARVTVWAITISRWGPFFVLGAGAAAFVLSDATTWSGRLAALAAALLGAPLLAARRGVELPLVAASATAAERGIIYQTPRALEKAGSTTRAVLCTHGTITEGKPEVVEVYTVDRVAPEPLVALAAATEAAAEAHPIARAIIRFAESREIAPESVRRAVHLAGCGVTALAPGGESFVLGNRQLLLEEGVSVAVVDEEATRAESRARTVIFMGLGGRVRGLISLSDAVRSGTRAAVQRLMDLGHEVVLLSGDHRVTVEALARGLDIDHIKAELLPDERGAEVRRLREAGGPVAVIGRAVHDDPALIAADVPVVLGAAGGPTGERAISLATEDLRDAATSLWLARAARAASWQSFIAATLAGVTIEIGAALGWVGPVAAAIAVFAIDGYALPSGARLLDRVAKRMPVRV